MATDPSATHVMQCMEVWGGNRAVDNGVVMPGLDAWVYSRPFQSGDSADTGGGDIHYVTSCATGRITRLTIADVSGHGASVARAAEELRRLMRRYSNFIDQARFVESLNRQFGMVAQGADSTDDSGAAFATAVIATYFAPTDELVISNAGHPRPLRFDANAGRWSALLSDRTGDGEGPANLPLGVIEPTRYPTTSLRLGRSDLVLFYTDSLIEARDANGRMLGQQGLLDLVGALDTAAPEQFIGALLDRINAIAGRGPEGAFDDDVTALLVRRNDLRPRIGLAAGTIAGFRIVGRALTDALRRTAPALPQLTVRSIGGALFRRLNKPG